MVELVLKRLCDSKDCDYIHDYAYMLCKPDRKVVTISPFIALLPTWRRGVHKLEFDCYDYKYTAEFVVNDPKSEVYDRTLKLAPDAPVLFVIRYKCKDGACTPEGVVYGNVKLKTVEDPVYRVLRLWAVNEDQKWVTLVGTWYSRGVFTIETSMVIPLEFFEKFTKEYRRKLVKK